MPIEDWGIAGPGGKRLRVYLRELVLPVRIGVFPHEKAAPQNVRFDVLVDVASPSGEAESLDDSLSYDLIRDVVVAVAAEGHTDLAETLAERIARRILREPRASQVTIWVEKLEIEPGRVGVQLIMQRPGAPENSAE